MRVTKNTLLILVPLLLSYESKSSKPSKRSRFDSLFAEILSVFAEDTTTFNMINVLIDKFYLNLKKVKKALTSKMTFTNTDELLTYSFAHKLNMTDIVSAFSV